MVPDVIETAAHFGDLAKIQEWLKEDGSDINGFDEDGWTLLTNAAWKGECEVVRFLLANGADTNAAGPVAYTALHAIARNIDPGPEKSRVYKAATLVLDAGANVDALCPEPAILDDDWDHSDSAPATPLMYAAADGNMAVIQLLLSRGASQLTTSTHDVEAIARRSENYTIASLLASVRRAGGWRAYVREPRVEMLVLRVLCEKGRATSRDGLHERVWGPNKFCPLGITYDLYKCLSEDARANVVAASRELFPSSPKEPRTTSWRQLPKEVFWKILSFWRAPRDFDPRELELA